MINRFKKILPSLYRGSAPSVSDVIALKNKLGINKIISLDYEAGKRIAKICKLLGIKQVMMPIMAKNVKSLKVFPALDWKNILLTDGPTFVHCLHGKDRTGLVIALFRCQSGWPASKAIREADLFDFCKGLPSDVRTFYEKLIHQTNGEDTNDVMDLLLNDGLTVDTVLNSDYSDEYLSDYDVSNYNPSFSVQVYEGIENYPYAHQGYNNSEYDRDDSYVPQSIKDHADEPDEPDDLVPEVGTRENYTTFNGLDPGPGVGYGYAGGYI